MAAETGGHPVSQILIIRSSYANCRSRLPDPEYTVLLCSMLLVSIQSVVFLGPGIFSIRIVDCWQITMDDEARASYSPFSFVWSSCVLSLQL